MFTRAFTYLLIYRHIPTTFGHHGFPRMLISSVYIWAPHNNDGDRSIDWRLLQSYSSNCNRVGTLSYGFQDSIEKFAQLIREVLYMLRMNIYAPRTIILVQYKLWIWVNEWSNIIVLKFYFHKCRIYGRKKARWYNRMFENVTKCIRI